MDRRTLLAAVATSAGGCLTSTPGDTPNSPGTTGTPGGRNELRITDLSVSTETERPSVRFVLEPTAFYSADAVERERERSDEPVTVEDVSDLDDPDVRSAVVTALDEGEWRSNDLPDGLAETVERVDFFTGVPEDDTYTHVGLTLYRLDPDRAPPVAFDASVLDAGVASGTPGALELELANVGRRTQEVFSGTVPPFGLVHAEAVDGDGRFLLWREYESEGCVTFTDDGIAACAIGKLTELAPSETITRRYEVLHPSTSTHPRHTAPPGPGRYAVTDDLGYSHRHGAPGSTLSIEVAFTLE